MPTCQVYNEVHALHELLGWDLSWVTRSITDCFALAGDKTTQSQKLQICSAQLCQHVPAQHQHQADDASVPYVAVLMICFRSFSKLFMFATADRQHSRAPQEASFTCICYTLSGNVGDDTWWLMQTASGWAPSTSCHPFHASWQAAE